jgi:ATP-dependent RNA helicase DDX3X
MSDNWNTAQLDKSLPHQEASISIDDSHQVNGKKTFAGWTEAHPEVAPEPFAVGQGFPPDTDKWDGGARIYQWNDEFGDVGPKFPDLEVELFGDPATRHDRAGLDFSK